MRRSIVFRNNEHHTKGFTLIETMFALLLMLMFAALFLTTAYVFFFADQLGSHHGEEELGIFMTDMKRLFDRSEDYWVSEDGKVLQIIERDREEITSFELYEDKIRRRVSGSGHVVWMQFVEDFRVYEERSGIRFEITLEGKIYHRSLIHPSLSKGSGGSV
ncbi:ComGF family competence protein [Salisediminibacterium halotolerans]|uniref:ComGF family competence protein n=1 Tax=Salisediminibacterium halotolerans TaxID=517425 RepID=UPI000EAF8D67|nr:ComGF family competence protein [Salisediminibacterium halotolerans]RLJ78093.1 competence protein ComGF [Actinophytocola xinjiangensis]RPE88569.1 competence protein ComGF [Salisediminibacterium halotolerans]TWG37070.1 competence protein ComGF [Salisediminibacterium halotolerans]GEL06925.1 hypothetical protein SHA02_03410 [Salisediminibacterium halotolerans]